MKNKKTLVVIIVGIIVLVFGYLYAKSYISSKIAQKSIDLAMQQIINLDFTDAETFEVNENITGLNDVVITIGLNKGILNVEPGDGNRISGEAKYLGQRPAVQLVKRGNQGQFTYKSADEVGEKTTLYLPRGYAYSVNVEVGAGEVNVALAENNASVVNVAAGAGKVNFAPPALYSSKSDIAAGAGTLNIFVKNDTGRKVLLGQGFSSINFGEDYTKIDGGYQTNNYQGAKVKTDLSIGQAFGGFNIQGYENIPE